MDESLKWGAAAALFVTGAGYLLLRNRRDCSNMDLGTFDRPVEDYAPSEPVTKQDNFPKPGTVLFKDWILETFGGEDGGIARDYARQPPSPHHEGRAWDWHPPSKETADHVIACLLANHSELARRAGLRNIIWYGRTWNAGRAVIPGNDGWAKYKHADSPDDTLAHRDHVHFAFSWAGARAQTSLYDKLGIGARTRKSRLLAPGPRRKKAASLAQVQTETVPAQRTPMTHAELRTALIEGHRAQTGKGPTEHRLRAAFAIVGHETDQTRSMWNWNFGNIMCTRGWPKCHVLKVRDPSTEPTRYRSYDDAVSGASSWWALMLGRYADAVEAFDAGNLNEGAARMRAKGYYGQELSKYQKGLALHAGVYDGQFGKPSGPGILAGAIFLLAAGGIAYKLR